MKQPSYKYDFLYTRYVSALSSPIKRRRIHSRNSTKDAATDFDYRKLLEPPSQMDAEDDEVAVEMPLSVFDQKIKEGKITRNPSSQY